MRYDVVARADGSFEIGIGHQMRALTLLGELRKEGLSTALACLTTISNAAAYAAHVGVDMVHMINEDIGPFVGQDSVVVVDHYGLDAKWERVWRSQTRGLVVIDDLADRPHDCDILIDQNLVPDMRGRYGSLVPPTTQLFLGPQWSLLRPEFLRPLAPRRSPGAALDRLVVSFGGSDPTRETAKVARALAEVPEFADLSVEVFLHANHPSRLEVGTWLSRLPRARLLDFSIQIAANMAAADLMIGAAGSSTWERCALGLPGVMIVVAENQRDIARAVHDAGAGIALGWHENVTPEGIAQVLRELRAEPVRLRRMSYASLQLMGHLGEDRLAPIVEAIRGLRA